MRKLTCWFILEGTGEEFWSALNLLSATEYAAEGIFPSLPVVIVVGACCWNYLNEQILETRREQLFCTKIYSKFMTNLNKKKTTLTICGILCCNNCSSS